MKQNKTLKCNRCLKDKDCSDFSPLHARSRGYDYSCKKCKAKYKRERKFAAKDNGTKSCTKCNTVKEYVGFHKDPNMLDGRRSFCKRCEHTATDIRRKRDPNVRIAENTRRRINFLVRGEQKSIATQKLLGCTTKEIMTHLELLFADGMTWENYGEWHIDHIKPCSKFDLTDEQEQLECFNYKNLQPLWAKDNLSKGDKYEEL
jgi:hypothetical protein